jgi:short-subunit dehydrogenase
VDKQFFMTKTIVVTGATKGIGLAIVQKFAQQGFNIAMCARNTDELTALSQQLTALGTAGKIVAIPCDVSKKEQLIAFAAEVNKQFKQIDILVNNAGTFLPGQVYNEADGTLEILIETNLYSAYYISRAFINGMIKHRSGHIFNMCSVASIQAYPNGGSYSISKYALLGLSKALREEMKPHNIKVTALIPGATYTHSWAASGLPEERFMKPEDIADIVWSTYHLSAAAVVEEIVLRPILGDI